MELKLVTQWLLDGPSELRGQLRTNYLLIIPYSLDNVFLMLYSHVFKVINFSYIDESYQDSVNCQFPNNFLVKLQNW